MADENTPAAPTPQATEGLSPAESRYFESNGHDVPGERDAPVAPAQAEAPAAEATETPPVVPPTEPAKHFVEKGSLDRERIRRQKAEALFEQANARLAALEARLAPQPTPVPQPTVEEDPLAVLKQIKSAVDGAQQAQQEHNTIVGILTASDAAEKEYAQEVPDYTQALDYLRARRFEQLQIAGLPQQRAIAVIQREAAETAKMAFERGKNPGELFYAYAKSYGWQGQQAAPVAPTPAAAQAPAPTQRQSAAHAALQMLNEGQNASASLSAAPGRSADGTSLSDILELEGNDFLKAWGRAEKMQRAGRA